MSGIVVVKEADEENWDLDGVLTAAGTDGNCLCGKFCELQTQCRPVHSEVPADLVVMLRMAKCSITREA